MILAMLLGIAAVAGRAAEPPGATWVTLGTSGGPAVQVARAQIANALVVGDAVYLFDVGNGVRRQMARAGLAEGRLRAVFLSHHHLDHNADLGPVLVSHWTFSPGVLPVIGPEGTVRLATGLAAANAPTVLAAFPTAGPAKPALGQTVRPQDIPADLRTPTVVYRDDRITVSAIGVDHYRMPPAQPLPRLPQAVAYRVEAGGRVFVYSGDTGPSPRLAALARGADVLVSEVVDPPAIAALLMRGASGAPAAVRDGIIAGMSRNHLVPAEIGRIARDAGVKQVVLTHFVPSPEDVPDRAAFTAPLTAIYPGKVTLANDLDRF